MQRFVADQRAQRRGQRRHVDGQPMAFQRPEGNREGTQHVLGVQQFQHGFAPVIEQGQWTCLLHQSPQSVEPMYGIAGQ